MVDVKPSFWGSELTVGPLYLAASSPLMLQQSRKPWHYGRRREPLALPLRRRRRAPFLPPPTQAMALLHHAPTPLQPPCGSRRLGGSAAEGRSARRLGGGAGPGDRLSLGPLGPRQLLRRLHLRAVRLAVEVEERPSFLWGNALAPCTAQGLGEVYAPGPRWRTAASAHGVGRG